jgi:hypothetical protein
MAKATHLMVDRKQRKRKGSGPGITFKGVIYFFQLGLPPKVSRTSHQLPCRQLGTKPSIHEPVEDI